MIALSFLLMLQSNEAITEFNPQPAPMAVGARETNPLFRIIGDILADRELVCEVPDTLMGLPTLSGSKHTNRTGKAPTKLMTLTRTNSPLYPKHTYDLGSYSAYKDGSRLSFEGTATAPNSNGSTVSFAELVETTDYYIDAGFKFIDLNTDNPRMIKIDIAVPKGPHSSAETIKSYVELGRCGKDVALPASLKNRMRKNFLGKVEKAVTK